MEFTKAGSIFVKWWSENLKKNYCGNSDVLFCFLTKSSDPQHTPGVHR